MGKYSLYLLLFFILPSVYASDLSIGSMKTLFTVDEIKVEGTKKVEPEAIIEKLEIIPGSKLTNFQLRSDIQKIYDMKYFDMVEAHHEVINKKNVLVLKVKEKPIIARILFEGNDELSSDDLKEQVKTKEYNILDVNTIKGDLLLLQNFYEEKGFYLATADYELKQSDVDGLNLIFKIRE